MSGARVARRAHIPDVSWDGRVIIPAEGGSWSLLDAWYREVDRHVQEKSDRDWEEEIAGRLSAVWRQDERTNSESDASPDR